MSEPTLEAEKKEVVTVESVSIRAAGNGFIVNVMGRDSDDDWASDEQVFLEKDKAVAHMSDKIGG